MSDEYEHDDQDTEFTGSTRATPQAQLMKAAFGGDAAALTNALASGRANVNALDDESGLAALHIAIGCNDLALCRQLVEKHGAQFIPDRAGRMPTLIAAQCRVDEELAEYLLEKEAALHKPTFN